MGLSSEIPDDQKEKEKGKKQCFFAKGKENKMSEKRKNTNL